MAEMLLRENIATKDNLSRPEWRKRVGFDNFYHADWETPTMECFSNYRVYESAVLTLAEDCL